MRRGISKYKAPFLLIILIAIGVFGGIKTYQLNAVKVNLEETLKKTERRSDALKKKYSEEKAMSAAMQRAKLASDSQVRELEFTVEKLNKEIKETRNSESEKVRDLKRKLDAETTELAGTKKNLAKLGEEYGESQAKVKQANAIIRDKDADLAKRDSNIKRLQSDLKNANQKIDRVVSHNAKLAELSQELLVKFDKKGIFSELLEKEPLTQEKRVDLEKMIQEYLDRIDKDTITDSDLK